MTGDGPKLAYLQLQSQDHQEPYLGAIVSLPFCREEIARRYTQSEGKNNKLCFTTLANQLADFPKKAVGSARKRPGGRLYSLCM